MNKRISFFALGTILLQSWNLCAIEIKGIVDSDYPKSVRVQIARLFVRDTFVTISAGAKNMVLYKADDVASFVNESCISSIIVFDEESQKKLSHYSTFMPTCGNNRWYIDINGKISKK